MKQYVLLTATNHGHGVEYDEKGEAIACAIKRRKRAKNGYQVFEKISENEQFAEYQTCFDTEYVDFTKSILRIRKQA